MKAKIQSCMEKYGRIVDEFIDKSYRGEAVSFADLCRKAGVLPNKHCLRELLINRYGEVFEYLVNGKRVGWRIIALLEYVFRHGIEEFLDIIREKGVREAFGKIYGDWVGTVGWYNFMRIWFNYIVLMHYNDVYAEIIGLRLKGYMVLDEEQYNIITSAYDLKKRGYYIYVLEAISRGKSHRYYVVSFRKFGKVGYKSLLEMAESEIRKRLGEKPEIVRVLESITFD